MTVGSLMIGALLYYFMGGSPLDYLAINSGQLAQKQEVTGTDDEKKFVSVVLADTEDVWSDIFHKSDREYERPELVLYSGLVDSGCGRATSSVGPFYCPQDHKLYLDLSFFRELQGDFAHAYVIAHEVGHHVQTLLGVEMPRSNKESVKFELQADCLAGVWAKQTEAAKNVIEAGDIQEAMNAASAVGDDRLQKKAKGVVVPDSFTHGSSAQRGQAFKSGYSDSDPQICLDRY